MSLTILHRRRLQEVFNAPVFVYDTSGVFDAANYEAFTVERSSDLVIDTFSAEEIADNSYTAWLNGSEGKLISLNPSKGNSILENTESVYLMGNGDIDFNRGGNLHSSNFTVEPPESYVTAMVLRGMKHQYNSKPHYAVRGSDNGFSFRVVYDSSTSYRSKQMHYAVQRNGIVEHKYFTGSSYNNDINSVIVCEVTPQGERFLVNGVEYLPIGISDATWTGYSDGTTDPNQIILGNRLTPPLAEMGYIRNLTFETSKTAEEISNELISIYQA